MNDKTCEDASKCDTIFIACVVRKSFHTLAKCVGN